MSVTLFPSGLVVSDTQATRLDAFSVDVWLPRYLEAHDGQYPTGWPNQAGHIELAEWSIVETMKRAVRHWEHRQAEIGITVPNW